MKNDLMGTNGPPRSALQAAGSQARLEHMPA
jgi:hypothetical protein